LGKVAQSRNNNDFLKPAKISITDKIYPAFVRSLFRISMKKILFFFLFPFLFGNSFAQNPKQITIHNDSLFQIWKKKRDVLALIRQKKTLHFLASPHKDSVFTIDLSKCNFTKLPDISGFRNIKTLTASYNHLKTVPVCCLKSDSLQEVVFSNNQLKRIRFPKNTTITSVKLNNNRFRRIPRSLKRLKNLKTLEMERNRIKHIPHFFRKMDALKEINLNFNTVKLNKQAIKNLSRIDNILLAYNHLKQLPENINEWHTAKKLNFANNELSALPASFEKLNNLKILIFYKNHFDTIPAEIFRLHQLIELDFYYNNLKSIPPAIGRLKNLKQLFLSFNHISVLPDSMRQLTQLRYLYIHHNDLKVIPTWIKNLTRLQRVGFGYNQLFFIPDISSLKALKEIDLQHNNLSQFPWKMANSPSIKVLILRNNPFILSQEDMEKIHRLVEEKQAHGYTLIP